jgi:predicted enzyme involved in methoxymalonyl-ACP biosynthesis
VARWNGRSPAEAALRDGVQGNRTSIAVYRPTVKNAVVKELYYQLGFTRIDQLPDAMYYEFVVPATPSVTATHVRYVVVASGEVTS